MFNIVSGLNKTKDIFTLESVDKFGTATKNTPCFVRILILIIP